MCFLAFLSEEPQGDSLDRTDSVGKAVGASVVSVETPEISPKEIFPMLEQKWLRHILSYETFVDIPEISRTIFPT